MQRLYTIPSILLACALGASAPAQAGPKYAYTVVPLAESDSIATAINNAGDVVGQMPWGVGFLYSNGVLTNLGTIAGDTGTRAWGINNHKQVVGNSYGNLATSHGFVYSNGAMHDIGSLAGGPTFAYDINDAGDIVGESILPWPQFQFAILYRDGVMRNLNCLPGSDRSQAAAINNKGQIAGTSGVGPAQGPNGNQTHAVIWEYGVIKDLGTLGGLNSVAEDINERGEVAGSSTIAGDVPFQGVWHAFIWSNGKMRDLGAPPGGDQVMALAINLPGDVVGYYNRSGGQRAFLYRHNQKMGDLTELVDPAQGWTITIAYDVNDAGQIVGQGCNQSSNTCMAVRLDPVPKEPGED